MAVLLLLLGHAFARGTCWSALGTGVVVIGTVWASSRVLDGRPLVDLGFHLSASWWQDLAFGLGLGIALMVAIYASQLALGWAHIVAVGAPSASMIRHAVVCGVAGIYEEVLFRGYWVTNLSEALPCRRSRAGTLVATVLSGMVFGALHLRNPYATIWAGVGIALSGTLVLGLAYALSGELALPIGLHVSWNVAQGALLGLPVSGFPPHGSSVLQTIVTGPRMWTGGRFGPEAGMLGLLATVLGALAVATWSRKMRRMSGLSPDNQRRSPIA